MNKQIALLALAGLIGLAEANQIHHIRPYHHRIHRGGLGYGSGFGGGEGIGFGEGVGIGIGGGQGIGYGEGIGIGGGSGFGGGIGSGIGGGFGRHGRGGFGHGGFRRGGFPLQSRNGFQNSGFGLNGLNANTHLGSSQFGEGGQSNLIGANNRFLNDENHSGHLNNNNIHAAGGKSKDRTIIKEHDNSFGDIDADNFNVGHHDNSLHSGDQSVLAGQNSFGRFGNQQHLDNNLGALSAGGHSNSGFNELAI